MTKVTMQIPKPLPIIGAVGSPYTRKMVALLRYRQIPYRIIWGDVATTLDSMGITKPKPVLYPTCLFSNNAGEPEAICDSTPIIYRLEKAKTERSVIPDDSALAFVNFLLEDYGDEWCTKFMFHYRWYFTQNAENAGKQLPLTLNVTLADEALKNFGAMFSQRQISRLALVGSTDRTAPVIEAAYKRLLLLLEAHFKDQPFLLGGKPGSCDFALYGQLSQLIGFDPTSRAIAYELSPRTVAWISLMEDQSGLDTEASQWQTLESLPTSLMNILCEMGRTYVPALLANTRALAAGEKQWQTEIDGCDWTQQSFAYQGKCLQWIAEQYQNLSNADKTRIDRLLENTGCGALLNLKGQA